MDARLHGLVPRRLGPIVASRMTDEPVVLLQGPRSVGKSTLLRSLADDIGAELVDLDDVAVRDAAARDPALFVSGTRPICIDEYQHVPIILDAIKAELNRDGRPGRFVLTGSARHDALPRAAQALTGRLHRLPVYPLSQGELRGVREHLLDDLFTDPGATVAAAAARPSVTTREQYIDTVTMGGFPSVLVRASLASRNRWFDDYVSLSLERDVAGLRRLRQAAALPGLLARLAGQTAQILNITRAASDVRLDESTAHSYVRLLEAVFLLYRLSAWGTTLTARSASSPKLHVLDSGVAARLLRLTPQKLAARSPTALTEFGHLLETFVVTELLKQASWADWFGGAGHWRTRGGDEVDLVIERDDGAIVAFEIKAAGRVPGDDLAPLRRLRDTVGDAFLAGVALYLGARSYTYEDRLHVLPVDTLWAP
ncbi:ATP-binding protein [Frankia sp. AgPm24]|uniref:ATP-binding protein n=1 Tax=Frankia sp. AgPm24 TaxID=631128 RepID=UPI00200CBA01|nr:ATP-binding protein [Frankia sp. AgPm24]MCK9922014.1 ATP-binding protein [Frankia sp. AgPm24]